MNIDERTLDQLKAEFAMVQTMLLAARVELKRKDEQIAAMMGEIERLRGALARTKRMDTSLDIEVQRD